METRGRARKASRLREILTALENQVVNLEESVGNMKETLELVEGRTDGFDPMEEQLRDFVLDSLDANKEKMNELLESTEGKLAERDEYLEDMALAMKKEIDELKGELAIYKATLSNGMLSSKPKQQAMDVSKQENLRRRRFTDEKRGGKAIGTWEEFQREAKKQLKPWEKHELRRQGITELTVAMAEAEFSVELGSAREKLEASKPNGKCNGERNYEEDEKGRSDDGNSTDSSSGNGKP
ncbi:hypothetical protein Golax_003721 [Gossypium laxum]|uniref:Uncharacterized protein n=1 Tax=Gossypium laxum TaxID=34288 RepID=A0A7J9AGQ2_9ROSI|nr:hypothetical protein [Gossypium laxum]